MRVIYHVKYFAIFNLNLNKIGFLAFYIALHMTKPFAYTRIDFVQSKLTFFTAQLLLDGASCLNNWYKSSSSYLCLSQLYISPK